MFTIYSIKPEDLVLDTQQLDTIYWSSVVSKSKGLQSVMPTNGDKVIGADLFTSLYHWKPVLKPDSPDKAMSAYMEQLLASQEFKELRSKTIGDRDLAAAGAVRLFRELSNQPTNSINAIREIKKRQDHADTMDNQQAKETMKGSLAQAQEQLAKGIEKQGVSTEGVNNTIDDLDAAEQLGSYGLSMEHSSSEKILGTLLNEELVSKYDANDRVRRVCKLAGRMRHVLEGIKSKRPIKAPPSPGVEYGDDLDRVMPIEWAYLSDPELEDLFYVRLVEGDLRIRELKDKVEAGLGPFIGVVDFSGSMSGVKETHALALFVTMARIAKEQGRDVWFIPFASSYDEYKINSPKQLVNVLYEKVNLGGSTRVQEPIDRALEIIKDNPRADVMLVSDMEVGTSREWRARVNSFKQDWDCKIMGFRIGNSSYRDDFIMPVLDSICTMGDDGEMSKLEWLEQVPV